MIEMNWKEFVQILGTENVKKIQDTITEEIIANLTEAIAHEWIIMPSEIQNMIDEIGEEIMEELKEEYKEKLTKIMRAELEK